MNNIIQKGGLLQKELAKININKFLFNKGGLTVDVNIQYILKWITLQIGKNVNGDIFPQADYCKIGPVKAAPDFKGQPATMSESDFYSGFNTDLQFVISQVQMLEDTYKRMGEEGIKIFFNKHLLAVDGVNIIHNIDILIGFLPLIIQYCPKFRDNVFTLINDIIKKNMLIPIYNGRINYINNDNMKVVLENVLPFIISNIKLSNFTNIMIFQHDSNPLDPQHKTVSHAVAHYIPQDEKKNMMEVIVIKIPKVTETGSSIPISLEPSITTEYTTMTEKINPAIIMAPFGTNIPTAFANKTSQFDGVPKLVHQTENDDAALINIALFYTKVVMHPNFRILSGDMYKQVIMDGVVNNRVCLEQEDSSDPFQAITFKNLQITKDTKDLDKKIFKLSAYRYHIIRQYLITAISIIPIPSDIFTYIDKKLQEMQAEAQRPTPMEWQAKYIKYKQKYLLLKSQYN